MTLKQSENEDEWDGKIDAIIFLAALSFAMFDIRLPRRLSLLRGYVHNADSRLFTLMVGGV
ncbi:hypothetical protein B5C06_04330 [Staphylococcus delphini]|nr:hypothetical protein B5C06_04330 [Staphylococcus delphini]